MTKETGQSDITKPQCQAFAEELANHMVKLGTADALSCMARVMCAVAELEGAELEFKCDKGIVNITNTKVTVTPTTE